MLPQGQPGWENYLVPDFLVVKGSEELGKDKVLVLVEVKRRRESTQSAIEQVDNYLEALQSKGYAKEFVAFLVLGKETGVEEQWGRRHSQKFVTAQSTVR